MPARPAGSVGTQRRFVQLIVAAGVVAAVALSTAMTMSNALYATVSAITDSDDTAATGAVVLRETGAPGLAACNSTDNNTINDNSSATCTTFNSYGGSTTMIPSNAAGTTHTVTTLVTFANTGSSPASSFTMTFGACTPSDNGTLDGGPTADLCSKLHVKVTSGSTVVVPDTTASTLALPANATAPIPVALIPAAGNGTTVPFTVTTYVDTSAGNAYQGLQASQDVRWTLSS